MIDKYYREWYEWDQKNKKLPINELHYERDVNDIKELVDKMGWTQAEGNLPVKFLQYMNDFYGMNYKIYKPKYY